MRPVESASIVRPLKPRRRSRWVRLIGYASLAWCLSGGPSTRPAVRFDPKGSWLEAKPLLMFTLGGRDLPADPGGLATALTAGLRLGLTLPERATPVSVDTSAYPSLGSLRIDVSGSRGEALRKPAKINKSIPAKPGITAGQFELIAAPVQFWGAKVDYRLQATDAHLGLYRDKLDRPVLMLTDAKAAEVELTVSNADLQILASAAAKSVARRYGVRVESASIALEADTARTFAAQIQVHVPGGVIRFRARMEIDPHMNATLSDLKCDGQGPVGAPAAALLSPFLGRYERLDQPLVEFPLGHMKLKDVAIEKGENVHITMSFGTP